MRGGLLHPAHAVFRTRDRALATHTRTKSSASAVTRITAEEFCGLAITTLGILCILNLVMAEELALATVLMGWTAPYFGLACLAAGAISLLGHRNPRWHLEAALGAVILLVALMVGSFIWKQSTITWLPILDGSLGGLFGQALGNMLLGALGRTTAGILVHLVAIGGVWLLVRYSPLMMAPIAVNGLLLWVLGRISTRREPATPKPVPRRETRPTQARRPDASSLASPESPKSTPIQKPAPRGSLDSAVSPAVEPPPPQASSQPTKRQRTKDAARPQEPPPRRAIETQKPAPAARTRRRSMRRSGHRYDELPSLELLSSRVGLGVEEGAQEKAKELEKVYADFNLPVEVVSVEVGPAVTRFGVKPKGVARGGQSRPVRVMEVLARQDDVALALQAESLNYRAPVPGRPYIGIEVPNSYRQVVDLKDVLASWDFTSKRGSLKIAMGRDATGKAVVADLLTAPHMLVGGATGTGKSTFVNSLLTSLLMQHGPDTLNLILVDPKRVEMSLFAGLPHIVGRVVTDPAVVSQLLLWLMLQMEARYKAFGKAKVRNILGYNQLARMRQDREILPYIVLIIDELAELLVGESEIEQRLCRLAQKCRATGIHIVLATQRPSVNVITGTIKANFPARVAFAVSSQADSRVILDEGGAETLLGRGDMFYKPQGRGRQIRVQGSWVDDQDIRAIVGHWKQVQRNLPETDQVETWRGLLDPAA